MNKFLMLIILSLFLPSVISAEEITPNLALKRSIKNNPRMKIAVNDLRRADLLIEKEDAIYVPVWTQDLGFEYGQSTTLTPTGRLVSPRNTLLYSSALAFSLPVGTQISAGLQWGRSLQNSEIASYNTNLNINVAQPLLRGFGPDISDAKILSAREARTIADLQKLNATSSLVKDVLTAYWELWLAQKNLEIQKGSLKVIGHELSDVKIKLDAGTVSPAEIITIQIEDARIQESVAEAEASLRQRSMALALLIGSDSTANLQATRAPTLDEFPSPSDAYAKAETHSYALMEARSRIKLQKIEQKTADNLALPKLDATGGLSFSGLGNEALDSLSSLGSFDAYAISLGLRLELPLSNRARRSESDRAAIALSSSKLQYEQKKREITSRISTLISRLETDQTRLGLARKTAKLAEQNVDAQSARFDVGRATTLQVVDSIRSVREANFRIVQIEVNIVIQKLELDHVIGTLISQWRF